MERAVAVAKTCGDHSYVLHGGANRLVPTEARFDLVADTEAILQENGQAGEVVTDAMLTTDGDCGTQEAGAREKECCVEIQHVEHCDDCNDPQDETRELVQHAGGSLDALTTAVFATFEGFCADAADGVLPPSLASPGLAVGNLSHDHAQDGVRQPSEDEAADHDGDCDYWSCEEPLYAVD